MVIVALVPCEIEKHLLQKVGLRETINQAAGALQKSGGTVSGNIAIAANLTTDSFTDKTTHIGQAYLSYVTLSDWAKPIGASEMCKPNSAGVPNGFSGGYWHVLGRRDAAGGYAGLLCGYDTANLWFGFNAVGKLSPEFARIYTERYKPTPGDIGAFALGRTGDTAATDKGIAWNAPSGVYQANVPGASCLILHFNMGVGSCPAVQFKVNYRNGGISYRSARDGHGFESDWVELMPATKTVQDIRLSTREQVRLWRGPGYGDQPPYIITGVINDNRDEVPDSVYRRALQKLINGTWYNVGGL